MRRARARALLGVSRRADPAGAAALRPLRLPRRLAGAALRRVQRPADLLRLRTCGDRLRRSGAAIRAGVEGARAAPTCPRGGCARCRDARAAGAPVLAFVPADGERALRRGHRPAEALATELGRVWELPVCAARPARSLGRRASEGSASRSAVATCAAPSRRHAHRRHACASSTTSTRAAPRPAPRHRRSGKAAPAEWRW